MSRGSPASGWSGRNNILLLGLTNSLVHPSSSTADTCFLFRLCLTAPYPIQTSLNVVLRPPPAIIDDPLTFGTRLLYDLDVRLATRLFNALQDFFRFSSLSLISRLFGRLFVVLRHSLNQHTSQPYIHFAISLFNHTLFTSPFDTTFVPVVQFHPLNVIPITRLQYNSTGHIWADLPHPQV